MAPFFAITACHDWQLQQKMPPSKGFFFFLVEGEADGFAEAVGGVGWGSSAARAGGSGPASLASFSNGFFFFVAGSKGFFFVAGSGGAPRMLLPPATRGSGPVDTTLKALRVDSLQDELHPNPNLNPNLSVAPHAFFKFHL